MRNSLAAILVMVTLAVTACTSAEDARLLTDVKVAAADVRVLCKLGEVLVIVDPTAVGLAVDAAGEAVCLAAGAVPVVPVTP